MDLSLLWFILIAVLWTGYLVLEGFDFGVGMLMTLLPRGDARQRAEERRVLLNTIGPVWDGNEVWLLTAGGATFAAFPEWYATLFSGFYVPLFIILLALIVRIVAIEWRGKIDSGPWEQRMDVLIQIGSWVPAILWGVAFGNLVRGVLLDESFQYVGGFWALLNPFALLGGLTTFVVFLTHGSLFVALKTDGEVRVRARAFAARLSVVAVVVAGAWVVWAQLAFSVPWTWVAVAVAAASLVGVVVLNGRGREGWAFGLSALAIVSTVVLIFGSMYPDVMPGLDGGQSLSIAEATSTDYTLTVMTWVAVILTPLVLLYQGWTYWVFRQRLTTKHMPAGIGLSWKKVREAIGGSSRPAVDPADLT